MCYYTSSTYVTTVTTATTATSVIQIIRTRQPRQLLQMLHPHPHRHRHPLPRRRHRHRFRRFFLDFVFLGGGCLEKYRKHLGRTHPHRMRDSPPRPLARTHPHRMRAKDLNDLIVSGFGLARRLHEIPVHDR